MVKEYIHLYVWACSLHTGGAYQIRDVVLRENEEWEPCACVGTTYIPIADFDIRHRLLREFTDEICDILGITVEEWNELVEKFKNMLEPVSALEMEYIKAGIVSGYLQVGESEPAPVPESD